MNVSREKLEVAAGRAQAAGDTAAYEEIQSLIEQNYGASSKQAPVVQYAAALKRAKAAGNNSAVEELTQKIQQVVQMGQPPLGMEQGMPPAPMGQQPLEQPTPESPFAEKAIDFGVENLGTIGGIAGGVAGGMTGNVPAAIALAGIATAGGELMSDTLQKRRLDLLNAASEGGISVGFDVATLALGKGIKSVAGALGFDPARMKEAFADIYTPPLEALVAGTKESLKKTQELLERGGGSLSAYQTGRAGATRKLAENIGEIGLASSWVSKERQDANVSIIRSGVQDLVESTVAEAAGSNKALGEALFGVIDAARSASIKAYGDGLEQIKIKNASVATPARGVSQQLSKYLRGKVTLRKQVKDKETGYTVNVPTEYEIDPSIVNWLGTKIQNLKDAKVVSPRALFSMEKELLAQVEKVNSNGYQSQLTTQWLDAKRVLNEAINTHLERHAPEAVYDYRALNKTYSETMAGILPTLTKNIVEKGREGYYEAIGRLALSQKEPSKVKAMLESLDASYATLGKETSLEALEVQSASEAKQLIRQGYLRSIFGDTSGDFSLDALAKQARALEKDPETAKVIMGETYPEYKQLLNAALEASKTDRGFLGSLFLRSKETAAVGNIANLAMLGGATAGAYSAGGTTALTAATAGMVLLSPIIMAKVATNKKAIRKLLLLQSESKKLTGEDLTKFVASNIGKVLEDLSEEDKEDIRLELEINRIGE